MKKKRVMLYPKSFLKKYSYYAFEIILAAFLVVMIAFDTGHDVLIIVTGTFIIIYMFANIRFFKMETEGKQVYLPKDKIKFGENDSNFYYYKPNVTDFGDELETPYFVFSKDNIKQISKIDDKKILDKADENFPKMFYASDRKDILCIEFKKPLEFQKYNKDDDMEIDESIRKIDSIYVSAIKANELILELN